ncbi:MAG: primosomal protein [Microbacteriaceae bacterium]|nr:primosomal protein [Microbacteriaceae bacterium]
MQENSGESRERKPDDKGNKRSKDSGAKRRDGEPRRSGDYRDRRDSVDGEKREYRGRSSSRDGERREYRGRSSDGGERREYKPRGERSDYRGRREESNRGDRSERPRREFGDRNRNRDDRPRREFSDRDRNRDDRPRREFGDRDRGRDDRSDRPRREFGDRDNRGSGSRERSWKPAGAPGWKKDDRNRDDRPRREYGDRDRSRDDRPRREYGGRDRNRDDRPRREYSDRDDRRRDDRRRDDWQDRPRRERSGDSEWRKPDNEESFKRVRRDPELEFPEDLQLSDLEPQVRASLKTLSKENADEVAKHLVMVQNLLDVNPELAHKHALAAFSRAARLGVIRETLAMTAYSVGDFALALKELQAHKRISGSNEYIGLMVDSERGMGRPEKALQLGRSVDSSTLTKEGKVNLAIAMSGAKLDLGDAEGALLELEIPELNPKDAHPWSVGLYGAYAEVLRELGREQEAQKWHDIAEKAYQVFFAVDEVLEVEEVVEDEEVEDSEGSSEVDEEAEVEQPNVVEETEGE